MYMRIEYFLENGKSLSLSYHWLIISFFKINKVIIKKRNKQIKIINYKKILNLD